MPPLINTAIPNPAPIAVPGVEQAPNAVSPQGTMQAAPMASTPAPAGSQTPAGQPTGQPGQQDPSQFIQAARAQGVPDDQIFNYLHQQGMIPTNSVVQQGDQPQGAQLKDTGSFLGNAANSTGQFFGGLGSAIGNLFNTDPNKNTAVNLGKVLGGLVETPVVLAHNLATGTKPGDEGAWQINNKPYEALINSLGERYGSWDAVKKTAYQDPIGFLADAASLASGAGEAVSAAGKVSDVARAVEIGGNITKAAEAVNPLNIATKGLGVVADMTKAGLGKIGPMIEQSNLRLTPVQRVANDAKLADVTEYITKNIKVGTPEMRFEQAATNVDKIEEQIQNYLQTDAKGVTISKQEILDSADQLMNEYKNDRDALAIKGQIEGFKSTIESLYPDTGVVDQAGKSATQVALSDINQLKRSTFANAFNQAGTKVRDAVEYDLGNMLKDKIEVATKDIPVMGKYPISEINRAYGVALTAKKLLKVAMGRPQVGFITRLLSDAIGLGTAGPMGGIAAHVIEGNAPVTAAKAFVGKAATAASKVVPKIKVPAGAAMAATAGSRANTMANTKIKKPKSSP